MNPQNVEDLKNKVNAILVNENGRTAILAEAERIVSIDRAATHGDAEDSFDTIAEYWTAFLQRERIIEKGIKITSRQTGMMMALFKIARTHNNPKHRDNYVDIAGYIACSGEIALKGSVDFNSTDSELPR